MNVNFSRLALVSLVVVCACNGDSTTTTTTTTGDFESTGPATSSRPDPLPDQESPSSDVSVSVAAETETSAFERAFGFELADMGVAVLRAQADYIESCMADRGYQYSAETALELALPPSGVEEYVASKLEGIEAGNILPLAEQSQSDQLELASFDCVVEAEATLPNPNMTMLRFVSELNSDVSTRAQADPSLVEATERRTACFEAVGYPAPEGVQPTAGLANEADLLVIDYQAGIITKSQAQTELSGLIPIEDELVTCLTDYIEVEQVVTDKLWAEVLESNPELVQQVNDATKDEIKLYEDYLVN